MTAVVEPARSLSSFAETVSEVSEAGMRFILLAGLKVRVPDTVYVRDALLHPASLHSYSTRLFLSEPIPGRGQNWNAYMFLGRQWHSPSWQGVPASLPLPQMLRAHLDAYR